MANTIITIEIAEQIKAALVAVVPSTCTVYVDGVQDTAGQDGDKIKFPLVAAIVNECMPMQYRSVLRAYPVQIEVATWYPEDKDQVDLYTIAHAVTQWLAEPTLTLTLAHWDALVLDSPPERGIDDRVQYFRWQTTVNTRKAT